MPVRDLQTHNSLEVNIFLHSITFFSHFSKRRKKIYTACINFLDFLHSLLCLLCALTLFLLLNRILGLIQRISNIFCSFLYTSIPAYTVYILLSFMLCLKSDVPVKRRKMRKLLMKIN